MKFLESTACGLITNIKISSPFFQVYKSTYTSRWQDHGTFWGFMFSFWDFQMLVMSFTSICLSSFSQAVMTYVMSLSVLESAWTFSQSSMIFADRSTLIATVYPCLVVWSPDPLHCWQTFTIKANHAINTVMFYFHLNKRHKEMRHFRPLAPPPPPLAPCAASSHYRLFSKST